MNSTQTFKFGHASAGERRDTHESISKCVESVSDSMPQIGAKENTIMEEIEEDKIEEDIDANAKDEDLSVYTDNDMDDSGDLSDPQKSESKVNAYKFMKKLDRGW